MRYEKYLLSSFFDISTTKSVDKNKLCMSQNGEYEFIGRTSVNWGVQGHLEKLEFEPNPKYSFSLVQVGETIALWREKEWYASQNIFVFNPKFDCVKECFLYFQGAINKEMSSYGSDYNSYPTMKSLSVTYILLPTLDELDENSPYSDEGYIPDFAYMEQYIAELEQERIAELEQERIAELEQYLVATGLNDYELTDEDKEVLALSGFGHNEEVHKEFREFIVENILNVEQTKSVIAKANLVEGEIPYVTRTISDNGYMGTCGNADKVNRGNCITIGAETGVAFYQPVDFVAGNKVYRLSADGLNEKHYLFLAGALNRLSKDYSYSNARIPEKIKKEIIFLPLVTDVANNPVIDPDRRYHAEGYIPDWNFMEKYIRAIEKIIIADVVRYKDEAIATTRAVVDADR